MHLEGLCLLMYNKEHGTIVMSCHVSSKHFIILNIYKQKNKFVDDLFIHAQ
jgi:hypothetical protein